MSFFKYFLKIFLPSGSPQIKSERFIAFSKGRYCLKQRQFCSVLWSKFDLLSSDDAKVLKVGLVEQEKNLTNTQSFPLIELRKLATMTGGFSNILV